MTYMLESIYGIYIWKKCELIFYSTRDGGDAQLQCEMSNKKPVVIAVVPFALAQISVGAFCGKKKLAMTSPKAGNHFCADEPPKNCWSSAFWEVWRRFLLPFVGVFLIILFMRFMLASLSFTDISGRFLLKRKHQILRRWSAASRCVTCRHMLAPTRIGHANLSCKR